MKGSRRNIYVLEYENAKGKGYPRINNGVNIKRNKAIKFTDPMELSFSSLPQHQQHHCEMICPL